MFSREFFISDVIKEDYKSPSFNKAFISGV